MPKRSRLSKKMHGSSKKRLTRSPVVLIDALPKKIDGWVKGEARSGFRRRKWTTYFNEEKGSYIKILTPRMFSNEYTFEASILGERPDVVATVYEGRRLGEGLKEAVKMANIWHKNRLKIFDFLKAPKGLMTVIKKDVKKKIENK